MMQPCDAVDKQDQQINTDSIEWTWELSTSIPSTPQAGTDLIRVILDQLLLGNWSEKELFAIQMSLEEAIMNAIKHGNESHPHKFVHVTAKSNDSLFYTMITDEGAGFDPSQIPDPTIEENLENPCGRGVMLMHCYMDSCCYNQIGNKVELWKRRS